MYLNELTRSVRSKQMFPPELVIYDSEKVATSNMKVKRTTFTDESPSFASIFKTYCRETSLHCFKYLVPSRGRYYDRLFWLVQLVIVYFLVGLALWKQMLYFYNTPVLITFQPKPTLVSSIPLPAVTLCPDMQVRKSAFNLSTMIAKAENMTENELAHNSYSSCNDFIVAADCQKKRIEDPCFYFQPSFSPQGACFSFNLLPPDQLFRNSDNEQNNTFYDAQFIGRETIWSAEDGFKEGHKRSRPSPEGTPPWSSPESSLTTYYLFLLKVPTKLFDPICFGGKGFHGYLHNPAEIPSAEHMTFYVKPGNQLNLQIKPKLLTIEDQLKTWSPSSKMCFMQSERYLKFFKTYTRINCEIECETNFTRQKCGCATFYQPRDYGTPVCGPGVNECLSEFSAMAALKRKSSEALSTPTKKVHKTKKGKDDAKVNISKKKTERLDKAKKKSDPKPLAITFPEEGKVEWNTIKKQSKMLTEARKQKKFKNSYDVIQEAKKKFEVFRNRKCQGAERDALVMECTDLMKGLLSEKAKSHDVARLIQWLLKLGSKEVKNIVVGEIINDIVTLAKCKYSSHIVKNIVVTCDSSIRRRIIGKFMGNVLKLLSSKVSAPILEEIYTKYSTSAEKFAIRRELYGDLCKSLIPTNQEMKFSDLLQQNPALAPSILTGLKATLSKCFDKNWLLGSPIVLTVLIDYLTSCGEKDRAEMIESLRSHVTSIIKNKVGADVGLIILKNSSAKEKKEIIKDMKGDIANIAVSPSGSLFLQHLIDSVDDTVLMKKALVPTVIENAEEIISNESGRKLISYIVAHRDGHFFHPSDINKLKMADDSVFVKKSAETRMKELQEACLPTLLSKIQDDPKLWLKDGCICLLTASILQAGSGEKLEGAFRGIADFLKSSDSRIQRTSKDSTSDDVPAIEDAAINKTLKKIIKDDASRLEKGVPTFTEVLTSGLENDVIERWSSTNRGCFALVFLLESGVQDAVNDIKSKMASSKITKKLKNSGFKGAEILLSLLK